MLRAVAGTLALVVFGCVLALLLLEALLQAGSAYTAATRHEQVAESPRTGLRIVTLGDSNTYGLFVEREQAYPQRLEARWNEAATQTGTQPRIEVVNLGYPGMNSSVLRNRFLDLLRIHRPAVVTIMVGVNDMWTVAEPAGLDAAEGLWDPAKRASRVYQLFFLLRYGRGYVPGLEMQGRWAPATRPPTDWEPQLRQNLRLVVQQAQAAGVQVILLTYPASSMLYEAANRILREMASTLRVPLIDLTRSFGTGCAGGQPCALLFADEHPTVQGHELAASRIEQALRQDGLLRAPRRPRPNPTTRRPRTE